MDQLTRRQFQQATLGSLLTYSLLERLFTADVFAAEVQPITARWLTELDTLGRDLKGQKLQATQWQTQVEKLFGGVDLPELLKFIDFDKLRQVEFKERGEQSLRMKFPEVEGLPTELVFGHQVFALQKGRSVAPHGHNNMATAFLILQGDFQGRHYDRLEDEAGGKTMIIRPSLDRKFVVGECSTVSDDKDNVHWFTAASDTGFIFNIHVLGVRPGRTGRVYVDPLGEKLSDGRIRARRIDAQEAYKLYG
ncbi:MAG: hypothetical protein J5I93_15205 [Pirellulaceae bacterium]|nr:hypothetical protein [Pirellulaceae bacterium]